VGVILASGGLVLGLTLLSMKLVLASIITGDYE
jgi:hypothetical protein